MIRTKVTRMLALAGFAPARKADYANPSGAVWLYRKESIDEANH